MTDAVSQPDCTVVSLPDAAAWAETLDRQHRAVAASELNNRPWMYWEWHNPWSRAATVVDSWALLDICQASALLDCVAAHIGNDIVLFDSQLTPNPQLVAIDSNDWHSDADFFPLDGPGGIVVRLVFGASGTLAFRTRRADHLELVPGDIVVHTPDAVYRYDADNGAGAWQYVIRYYAANRHFDRDPAHPLQARLADRYPWVNYSSMPHWLLRGEDRAGNDFVTGFRTRPGHWTLARAAGTPTS